MVLDPHPARITVNASTRIETGFIPTPYAAEAAPSQPDCAATASPPGIEDDE
jgi:hypothetical protein